MGADTEIKNMNGDTPLHIAIKNNALKSTEILAALPLIAEIILFMS